MSDNWGRISLESARNFLDLGGAARATPGDHWEDIATQQIEGAVAVYNRLCDQHLVWLGDEVGLGKTFVALAVAALVRRQHPTARILYLLPSSRLQPKWRKERERFTRHCVRQVDHRARTYQGEPARPLFEPTSLHELAYGLSIDPDRDVMAPLSAFSFGLPDLEPASADPHPWLVQWERLRQIAPRLPREPRPAWYRMGGVPDKWTFKRLYAAALNTLLPRFDLVICDEAHNLKAGLTSGAARNLTVAAALGGVAEALPNDWSDLIGDLEPKVERVMCLTATPVERSFAELAGQASVFGMGPSRTFGPHLCPLSTQEDMRELETAKEPKEIAKRYVIRRLHQVHIGGKPRTKNQYRREWRGGGMQHHDAPLQAATPVEKLMVALVQKKVIETLHATGARSSDGTFLPSFQIGMLSSFESFGESIERQLPGQVNATTPEIFEDKEGAARDPTDAMGKDTGIVDQISRDFQKTFGQTPPHPKQNQVARAAAERAAEGDKSLIFVRRVRSTEELATRITEALDERLIALLTREAYPGVQDALRQGIDTYREARRIRTAPLADAGPDDDEGDSPPSSFFAWYFTGSGEGIQDPTRASAFRRRTLQDKRHPWYALLHDNHVLWLFGDNTEKLRAWVALHRVDLEKRARSFVGASLRRDAELATTSVGDGHWFEAFQAAALDLLSDGDHPPAEVARWLRHQLYPAGREVPWVGSVEHLDDVLLMRPFFAALRGRTDLCAALWPGAHGVPLTTSAADLSRLKERELRRELMTSQLRLGRPTADLWLALTETLGTAEPPGREDARRHFDGAVEAILNRLDNGRTGRDRHEAYAELAELATHHALLTGQNFSSAAQQPLHELGRHLQSHLSRQAPVLALHGHSKSERALIQFRMPGYPLVLVATDVIQEGVDLHTFCKRVVHYGLTGSSAGTEQRTGRVDRLGSLAHRVVNDANHDTRLQVHFPHLRDTVEPLQARVLYERMNHFMQMVHDDLGNRSKEDAAIGLAQEIARGGAYPRPFTEKLQTSFAVRREAQGGPPDDLSGAALSPIPVEGHWLESLERLVQAIDRQANPIDDLRSGWMGEMWLTEKGLLPKDTAGLRRQPYEIWLRSRRDGSGIYLRIDSPIARMSVTYQSLLPLLRLASHHPGVSVAATPLARGWSLVLARMEIPVWSEQDLDAHFGAWFNRLLVVADAMERSLPGNTVDLSLEAWRKK